MKRIMFCVWLRSQFQRVLCSESRVHATRQKSSEALIAIAMSNLNIVSLGYRPPVGS